jgi:hypothetical protein
MEIIGKNFAKRINPKINVDVAPANNQHSVKVGIYTPKGKESRGLVSVGTMISNLSNHIPINTATEATKIPGIFRVFLKLNMKTGITKLPRTIDQKRGA